MVNRERMAKRSRPLPDAEIRRLARLWRETGDRNAIRAMVEGNLGFANSVAARYRSWGLPMEDLFHESVLGLIRACEKFDPDGKARITTYAQWWCMAFLGRYVLRSRSSLKVADGRIDRAISAVSKSASGKLTNEEIATQIGRSVEDVERVMLNRAIHPSLESMMTTRDGEARDPDSLGMIMGDHAPGPEELVSEKQEQEKLRRRVKEALKKLPARDALIMRRRYMGDEDDPVTLAEVGRGLGLSRERVRQLEDRAKEKLRRLLKAA